MENLLQYNDGKNSFNILFFPLNDKFYLNLDESLVNKLGMRNFYHIEEGYMILNNDEFSAFKIKLEKNYISDDEIEKDKHKTLEELKEIVNLSYGSNINSRNKGKNSANLTKDLINVVKNSR